MDGQPSLLDIPNQKTIGDSYVDSLFESNCPSQLKQPMRNLAWDQFTLSFALEEKAGTTLH